MHQCFFLWCLGFDMCSLCLWPVSSVISSPSTLILQMLVEKCQTPLPYLLLTALLACQSCEECLVRALPL